MNKALVLIDFENEWLDKDSDYYVGDISKVILRTNKLINYCKKKGYKIIWTKHIEEDSDYSFKKGSFNTEFFSGLNFKEKDIIVEKNKISPFYMTNMEKKLDEIEEVIVCGILSNLCVRSFIEGAYDRDMNIIVVKDCCVSFDDETQNFTFKDLKLTREEIEFVNLKEFISE